MLPYTAVGVAHHALEEINPEGDTVLIIGTHRDWSVCVRARYDLK